MVLKKEFVNPFNVLLKPSITIKYYLNNPNFLIALILILLPLILLISNLSIYGILLDINNIIYSIIIILVSWFISSFIIYFIEFALKGKKLKTSLTGIMSCVALLEVPAIILTIILIISFVFTPMPFLLTKFSEVQKQKISLEEFDVASGTTSLEQSMLLFYALTIITLIFFLFYANILYNIIKNSIKLSPRKNLLILIILLLISFITLYYAGILLFGSLSNTWSLIIPLIATMI